MRTLRKNNASEGKLKRSYKLWRLGSPLQIVLRRLMYLSSGNQRQQSELKEHSGDTRDKNGVEKLQPRPDHDRC